MGLDFAAVCAAMNQTNIGSYNDEFRDFVREHGIAGKPFVPMATHSMGDRDWVRESESDEPLFFEEPTFSGGWYLFEESHVHRLFCRSATSSSWLEAAKQPDRTWTLGVGVPIENGVRYEGCYWQCFHTAIGEPIPIAE